MQSRPAKKNKPPERRVYLESLGCNKNTVDSEVMLAMLGRKGYRRVSAPEEASLILVNTCAFIDDAKEEAVNTVLDLARRKNAGSRLVVAGCLPQIHHREIVEGIPEVDAVIGIGNLEYLLHAAEGGEGAPPRGEASPGTMPRVRGNQAGLLHRRRDYPESRVIETRYREYPWGRELITPKGHAYLKISEGCGRKCSFCLIPRIRGKPRSRTVESILEEAKTLAGKGVREIILTSQDTLSYGKDLGMEGGLRTLVEKLVGGTRIDRLRLLYLRPGRELFAHLDVFGHDRVLPYFDIPVQHASAAVLGKMQRGGGYESFLRMVERIRGRFPEAVLRTTLITGFPGEGKDEFDLLVKFVEEAEFDHLGVFPFSPQSGTKAASLEGRARARDAKRRRDVLLARQREISRARLRRNLGRTFDVLIDGVLGEGVLIDGVPIDDVLIDDDAPPGEARIERMPEGKSGGAGVRYGGRSYHFAPEVDGLFIVQSPKVLRPGDLVKAVVTGSGCYDLYGRPTR